MTVFGAVLLSLIAGLATGVGGALVLVFDGLDMRAYDTLIGFAAGVMTAIATLGLIQEAFELGGIWVTLLGVAIGALVLHAFDRFLPHEHEHLPFECVNPLAYRRGLLLFAAMTLHNLPEGLAVGTSFSAQPRLGLLLALAIALHNIPEGIAVAGPFMACGMPRWRCFAWTVSSGLAEPVAALVGALFVSAFQGFLPFSLAFAGGAMLYVVSDELIPESHSHGYEHQATFGFISGFVLFMALVKLIK
jgi:ZIP family zinc transporter